MPSGGWPLNSEDWKFSAEFGGGGAKKFTKQLGPQPVQATEQVSYSRWPHHTHYDTKNTEKWIQVKEGWTQQ
jgi:hypothetical protein